MKPVLYILMRSDMDSLNPGKAMAQSAHAASMFHNDMMKYPERQYMSIYQTWLKQTPYGFGTKIVLDAFSEDGINKAIEELKKETFECVCGVVMDPTYPIKDGCMTHYVSIVTCGYIFVDSEKYTVDLPLYK